MSIGKPTNGHYLTIKSKKMIKRLITILSIFYAFSLKANDIPQAYQQTVQLASGYEQLIKESPSAVSVVTANDIEKMGAVTLEEVLETIPGIHVGYANGFLPTYIIRGVGSSLNTPVLIYLDGIAINNSATSTSYFALSHLAKNIEKIEIIKGPGSALYGANAFSGVINIISKKRSKDVGGFVGNFDTYGGWLNHYFDWNDFKISVSSQGRKTNGGNGLVENDRQSELDQLFRTSASLAPGAIDRSRDEMDLKVSAHYKDKLRLYARYTFNETGNGVGVANALENDGFLRSDSWIAGLKFNVGPEDWITTFDFNYTGTSVETHWEVLPKGAVGGLFNTPVINNVGYTGHIVSTQVSTLYQKIQNHTLNLGMGYKYEKVGDIKDERNFLQGPFNLLLPAGSIKSTEELGVQRFVDPVERHNFFAYIQDEWQLTNDVALTAGVRLDYFSDFGLTINPRSSLIWETSHSLTTKLMYGRAFRAPSFFELDTNPGISVTGNPDLNPETLQTVELSFIKKWSSRVGTNLNLFWYETDDLIAETKFTDRSTQSENRIFKNSEGVNAYGLEVELDYQLLDNITIDMSYAYLKMNPKGTSNSEVIIYAPTHQVYAAINWEFLPNWSLNLRSKSILGRKRSFNDNRTSIKDYTQVDFTLQSRNILNYFNVTFKINNLLDANVREPSLDGGAIPNDFPIEGRTFMGLISAKF